MTKPKISEPHPHPLEGSPLQLANHRHQLALKYAAGVFTQTGIQQADLERLADWSVKAADAWLTLEALIDQELAK